MSMNIVKLMPLGLLTAVAVILVGMFGLVSNVGAASVVEIGEVYPADNGFYDYNGSGDRFEAFIPTDSLDFSSVKFEIQPDDLDHDSHIYSGVSRRGSGTNSSYTSNATVDDIKSDTGMSAGDTFSLTVSVFGSPQIDEKTVENITLGEYVFNLVRPEDNDTVTGSPNLAQVNISEGVDIETPDVEFRIIPDETTDTQEVAYQSTGSASNSDGTRRYVANEDVADVVVDTNMRPGDTFTMEVSVDGREDLGTVTATDVVLGDVSGPIIVALTPATDDELSFDGDNNSTLTAEILGFDEDDHEVWFSLAEDGGNGAGFSLGGGSLTREEAVFSLERNKTWFENVTTDDFAGTFSFQVEVRDGESGDTLVQAEANPFTVTDIEPVEIHEPNPQSDWPSTNDANRENSNPHVNLIEATEDEITLEFVSDKNYVVNFEIRVDGVTPEFYETTEQPLGDNQVADVNSDYDPIADDIFADEKYDSDQRDRMYGGCNMANGNVGYGDYCPGDWENVDGVWQVTIPAAETVEVRQALGAESSHRFNWEEFVVIAPEPEIQPVTTGGGGGTRQSGNDERRAIIAEQEAAQAAEEEDEQPDGEVLGAVAGVHLQGSNEFIALLAQLVAIIEAIQAAHAAEDVSTEDAIALLEQLMTVLAALQSN